MEPLNFNSVYNLNYLIICCYLLISCKFKEVDKYNLNKSIGYFQYKDYLLKLCN